MPAPSHPRLAPVTVPEGLLLAGRYRLVRELPGTGPDLLWQARDETLQRQVAVRVCAPDEPGELEPLLEAGRRGGRLARSGVARLYDVGQDDLPDGRPVAFVVREWVSGLSLGELLTDEPLEPRRAAAVTAAAGETLAGLHAAGLVHGRVHPGNVVVADTGAVVLTDPDRLSAAAATPADDLRGLAATLYAAVTGTWPLAPAGGRALPPARRHDDGRLYRPVELRAGVPRILDQAAVAVLEPATRPVPTWAGSTAEWSAALGRLGEGPSAEEPVTTALPVTARARPRPPRSRRVAVLAAAAALLAGAAAAGALLATSGSASRLPAFRDGRAGPTGAGLHALPIAGAQGFNPEGTGPEDPQQVPASYDRNPATAWHTEIYTTANFGNLKAGTGVRYDLGRPQSVREVALTFDQTGQGVEVLSSDAPGSAVTDYRLVGASSDAGRTLLLPVDRTARYFLVWLTRLPPVAGGYQGDIAEVRFLG